MELFKMNAREWFRRIETIKITYHTSRIVEKVLDNMT